MTLKHQQRGLSKGGQKADDIAPAIDGAGDAIAFMSHAAVASKLDFPVVLERWMYAGL